MDGTSGNERKVLQLAFDYSAARSGGLGAHVQDLAHGQRSAGWEPTVLTHAASETHVASDAGVEVHHVAASPETLSQTARSSIAQNILAFNRDLVCYAEPLLARAARRPDIIHYHHWFTFSAAQQLGAMFDIPILGTVHYLTHPIEQRWGETPNASVAEQESLWLGQARHLITISESMRTVIAEYYPQTSRPHVVRNSINLDVFGDARIAPEARAQLRRKVAKGRQRVVLFAGRINPMKGLEPLVDSAAIVLRRHGNVQYVIAGAPDSRDYSRRVHERIEQHPGLADSFTWLGRVSRQHLALLLQVADVAVFPSIYEPLGMVAAEAMAAGVPPIVSSVGGLPEIVEHERTGLHVPVDIDETTGRHYVNVEALAAAQIRLLEDDSLRVALGLAGREHARHEYTFARCTLRPTLEVYREVIAKHRSDGETKTRESKS